MPGQSGIGSIFGAFRSDRPDIRYATIDPARQARLGNIWSEYDTSASPANNANYLAAYAANTPQAQKISQGNLGFLNQYATGAYDPTKSYGDILNLNQQALGNFLINPALNELTRQRKEAQARAGYGGQGAGTYDQLLQDRSLQALASQAVPNLLGNTTAAYNTAGQLGQQNFLNRLGIIGSGEQYRQLDIPALRYLEPTRLARSDVQSNLENLAAISKQEDLNRAYYRQPGLAERIGRGLNEIQSGTYSELNDVLDLAAKAESVYSGAGGLTSGGGGGAGGGGGNIQQLMKMYGAQGGGQNPYANPYTNSYYGASPYQPYGWGASGNYGDPTTNVPYRWGTPGSPYESKPPWANVGGGN